MVWDGLGLRRLWSCSAMGSVCLGLCLPLAKLAMGRADNSSIGPWTGLGWTLDGLHMGRAAMDVSSRGLDWPWDELGTVWVFHGLV
jgi:hypothetical protein